MHKLKLLILMFALSVGFIPSARSQIGKGGTPPTFEIKNVSESVLPEAAKLKVPITFNVDVLKAEDAANARSNMPKPLRTAECVTTDISMENAGVWTKMPDGRDVWRVSVEATGAKAVILGYDEFYLPQGSQLFIYNKDKSQILGAFDETTNPQGGKFSTQFVAGDVCILEYVAPAVSVGDKPRIKITSVGYGYANIHIVPTGGISTQLDPGSSVSCQVNVICSPEGDDWQTEKTSAMQITLKSGASWYYCTGSLINNTANDYKPYVISAYHCYEGASTADLQQWQFIFFFESSQCATNVGYNNYQTLVGAQLRAAIPLDGGSDGLLLELSSAIPTTWITNKQIKWLGWDRRNAVNYSKYSTQHTSGVCISHPSGDVKKIATFKSAPQLVSNAHFVGGSITGENSHWRVFFEKTNNGWSRTQGGSSGSSLLNQDKRIIGTLSGGNSEATCGDEISNPPYGVYGAMSYHWDTYGSTPATQMKTWLDPNNTGAETCDALPNNEPSAKFVASQTLVGVNENVSFVSSLTLIDSVKWEFEGATPATSTTLNPIVTYETPGTYKVKLTAYYTENGVVKTIVYEREKYIKVMYRQTIVPIANIEKTYGDPMTFIIDHNATDGYAIKTTADTITYFKNRNYYPPVKLEVVSGNILTLRGTSGNYTIIVNKAGTEQMRAYQVGIENVLFPSDTVYFTIKVNKLNLTARAVNAERYVGKQNPNFTLVYETFINGDNASSIDVEPTVTCSASPVSDAGTYDIVVSGGSDNFYNIITENGTLTVRDAYNVNAFTPYDKDGYNDTFLAGYKIRVFNRYGVLMYESKNDAQIVSGWDGSYSSGSGLVAPGIYYFVAYKSDGTVIKRGSVAVLKK